MNNLSEIRGHIRAVEGTKKITNAMYLLSTARMKKIMQKAEYNREYYFRVRATIKDILLKSADVHTDYVDRKPEGKALYVVISADKGLAGPHNANLLNFAHQKVTAARERPYLITIGLMAKEFFHKKGLQPDIELYGVAQDASLHEARKITDELMQLFGSHMVDEVYFIFTRFVSSVSQHPDMVRLLPFHLEDYGDVELEYRYSADMLYEPSPEDVFHALVPQYAIGQTYGVLMHSYMSEQSARMNAMQSATRNADEMLGHLRTQYNIARQYAITQEITEITAAAEAGRAEERP